VNAIASLHAGIDVSLRELSVLLTDEQATTPFARLTLPNDAGGALRLVTEACQVLGQHGFQRLRIAMEATGVYAWHLAVYLTGSQALAPYGPEVYLLQPRAVKHYRETFGAKRPKTDHTDRWLLAEMLGHGHLLPHPFRLDERSLPLQRLTRHRYHLVRELTRNKNYAASYLFLKASALAQRCPLSDPFGVAAAGILMEYRTVEDIAAAPLEELVSALDHYAKGHLADPVAIAKAYRQAARDSFRLPGTLKEPVHQILSLTLEDIRYLQRQVQAVERLIEREPLARDNRLRSIPGFGPVFSAGILAEIGDVRNFPDDDALAQYAGLTWPASDSGDSHAEETPLARTGNAYLRYYLTEAANSVRRHDAKFAAYYSKKLSEVTKHQHHRALVLTARKLLRLVFALLRDDRAYDPGHVPVLPREVAR
jgi:transposase